MFFRKYGLFLLFGAVAVGIVYFVHSQKKPAAIPGVAFPHVSGVQSLLVGQASSTPQKTIGILFTGNGLTSANDLPMMLAYIAKSDATSPLRLEIQSDTHDNQGLSDIWRDGQLLPLFRSRKWDFVVLQDQSGWIGHPTETDAMYKSVEVLSAAIKSVGGQPLLFMTWAVQPGSKIYKQHPDFQNPDYMLQSLDYYMSDIGKRAAVPVVSVGDYWARANTHPELHLYGPDGFSPSMAGTYLSALVFYRAITQRDPHNTTFVPPGISPADAATLRDLATQ